MSYMQSYATSTVCARDRGLYEVKTACRQSEKCVLGNTNTRQQMSSGLKFLVSLSTPRGLDKANEPTKNRRFDIYVYEGQDLWHTR